MDLGTIQYNVEANTTDLEKASKEFDEMADSAKDAGSAIDGASKKFDGVGKKAKDMGEGAKSASSGLSGMSRSAGQAGIQIQQFVGQVQGGQNGLLALSAQATDLGIVLGAPLFGVIVGLSSAIAGALVPSLFNTKDTAEDVAESIGELIKKLYDLSDAQRDIVLTAQGYNIKEKSNEYLQLTKTIEDQQVALKKLNDENGRSVLVSGARNVVGGLGATAAYVQIIDNTKLIEDATKKLNEQEVIRLSLLKEIEAMQDPSGAMNQIKNLTMETDLIGLTGKALYEKIAAQKGYTDSLAIEFVSLSMLREEKLKQIQVEKDLASEKKRIEDQRIREEKQREDSIRKLNDQMQKEAALMGNTSKEAEIRYGISAGLINAYGAEAEALIKNAQAVDVARAAQQEYKDTLAELNEFGWESAFEDIPQDANKFAEDAAERINGAFASAWMNISDDAGSAFDGIQNAFKQMLAELAHQALTKPIIMNIQGMMQGSGGSLLAGVGGAGMYAAAGLAIAGAINSWNKKQEEAILKLTAEYVQQRQSTGTLLGDANKKSESINNSLEYMASISENTLGVNVAMLSALNDIKNGIGRASAIFGRTGVSSPNVGGLGTSTFNQDVAGLLLVGVVSPITDLIGGQLGAFVDGVIGGVSKAIYSKKKKVIDTGIQFVGQSLADILTDGTIEAFSYAVVQTKKKTLGVTTSNKTKTVLGDLESDLTDQFALVFEAGGDALREASKTFGLNFDDYIDRLVIDPQKLSLKGLEGDELTAEIEAFFSSTLDEWAKAIVGTQSLIEVELTATQKQIEKILGKEIFERQYKTVNEGSEILAQFQKVGEGAFETVMRLASELNTFNYYADALNLNFDLAGFSAVSATQKIAEFAGGFDKLSSSLNTYYTNFFSQSEMAANQFESLSTILADIGVSTVPTTKESFRALVEGLDLSTEAGQKQFASLVQYSGAVNDYINALEKQNKSIVDSAYGLLQRSVDAEKKIIDSQIDLINSSLDVSKQVYSALESSLSGMIISSNRVQEASRRQAQSQLSTMLSSARAGSLPNINDLNNALSVISQPSGNLYSTFEDYATDFYKTASTIKELQDLAGEQVSTDELALDQLRSQSDLLTEMVDWAKLQVDGINGVDNSITSVAIALNNLSAIVGGQFNLADQMRYIEMSGAATKNYQEQSASNEMATKTAITEMQTKNKEFVEIVKSAIISITENTGKTSAILSKFDKEGLPQERDF